MSVAGDVRLPDLILPWGQTTGEEAFEAWRETVSTIFDLDTTPDARQSFRFGFSAWHMGSVVLGLSRSDPIRFERTPRTVARSLVDHYLVQVYDTGGLVTEADGTVTQLAPGDVWILDLTRTARVAETGFRSTNLAVPRNLLAPLVRDPDALHGLTLARTSPVGSILSAHLQSLASEVPRMDPREAAALADATIHFIAACSGAGGAVSGLMREPWATASLPVIRRFVETELHNPSLDVDMICAAFAMSRASLYRLCEPLGGIHAHIQRRRLARCFRDLVAPGTPAPRISQIAFRWGFSSEATFSRAFRAAYGMSPRDAREEGMRLAARAALPGGEDKARSRLLSQWIVDLMKV